MMFLVMPEISPDRTSKGREVHSLTIEESKEVAGARVVPITWTAPGVLKRKDFRRWHREARELGSSIR